jgi:hypothetical protein
MDSATAIKRIKPPFQVVLVWHPRLPASEATEPSSFLYTRLGRDEANPQYRGAGIPVYFRADKGLPVLLNTAYSTIVVPLISNSMIADPAWSGDGYVGQLASAVDRTCLNRIGNTPI